ncbi:beta-ketoadipyl CoA thiolase [Ureibacillus massiliensis 4400831 = CIP 108448 = CCUG 49529]|uniref:acetyl-CoA C-acetyltransferase n=1 Tax=Ureibacillus massiliensis 4400831 = CIP 108448 = CCUG 49529 TaxID=1211035 RepID=A0A0A3IMJ7_9BACL|nr:acetyl-CoA C-acetyltransferase [Ureibacillus massiliensis]KGR84028.1 beta-ketoadipyl CoA thiolase [Ureibacillus massiliensis 4400831 = CIP 108448 = CCUG 49529]
MVYIIEGSRTAFGSFGGSFLNTEDVDLGVSVTKEAIKRSEVNTDQIDEIIFGNIIHTHKNSAYLARHIGLKSGLPQKSSALTVNRLCGSGLQAILSGAQSILLGDANIIVAGGTENMSRAPHVLRGTRFSNPNKAPEIDDMLWGTLTDEYIGCGMGITAENLAKQYQITREEQDEFAVHSHIKAMKAIESGRFSKEIVPVVTKNAKGQEIVAEKDEHVRSNINIEKMSTLKPAFLKDGTVTAGNASGINDGAAAVVIASEKAVNQYNLKPLSKIVAWAVAGVDPNIMGIGPVPAIQKVLSKSNLTVEDIDLFELNEAFAAQSLAVIKELQLAQEKVNVNGGAIALGHPVGASGARITYSLAKELQLQNKKYGIASLCIGGGQGIAVLLENLQ